MNSENRQLSKVVPLLIAALVCDVAVADPSTGKKNLIGIFDRIMVGKVPTSRQMTLYLKLADADGSYDFEVKYVQVGTGSVLAGAKGGMQANDKLAATDLCIPFPPLPIPSVGRYEFQIWANSMFLGSAALNVTPLPKGG